jgi:hypothetical protein
MLGISEVSKMPSKLVVGDPPLAAIMARNLRRMEAIMWLIPCCGMAAQSACNAIKSSLGVAGALPLDLRCLSSSSHMCSIGFKSGESEGQGRVLMLLAVKKAVVNHAVWGMALSCWNTALGVTIRGRTCGCTMS